MGQAGLACQESAAGMPTGAALQFESLQNHGSNHIFLQSHNIMNLMTMELYINFLDFFAFLPNSHTADHFDCRNGPFRVVSATFDTHFNTTTHD
jgi:hypothetical protein